MTFYRQSTYQKNEDWSIRLQAQLLGNIANQISCVQEAS